MYMFFLIRVQNSINREYYANFLTIILSLTSYFIIILTYIVLI